MLMPEITQNYTPDYARENRTVRAVRHVQVAISIFAQGLGNGKGLRFQALTGLNPNHPLNGW